MTDFHVNVPVRFNDIDMFGHVNSPVYLSYCEINRVAMFTRMHEETGSNLMARGFVVAETHIRYLIPVTLEHEFIHVSCSVGRIGRSSFQLNYAVKVDDVMAAEAEVTVVLVGNSASRPMTDQERDWLTAFKQ